MRGEVVFNTEVIGDFVIVRSDGRPQYNFAVVVDDALMEVTHVIRGEDHISNTPRQILLYQALGFTPPEFAHLSLVLGPDHTPLSKRHGATSVAEFRARGYLPEALVNYLALIGWSPRTDGGSGENDAELLPVDEMARRFAIEDVGHSAGIFDFEKLAWMNRHYMKAAAPARLAAESLRFFTARGFVTRRSDEAMEFVSLILPMAVGSVDRLEEIPDRLKFLFEFDAAAALATPEVAEVMDAPGARDVVVALADELRDAGRLDRDAFRAAADRVKQRTGQKGAGAVPSDSRGADRRSRRPRARSRRAGDRSRRRAATVGRRGAGPRLPRARRDVRAHGALMLSALRLDGGVVQG